MSSAIAMSSAASGVKISKSSVAGTMSSNLIGRTIAVVRDSDGYFVRDQAKEDRAVEKLQEMRRILEQHTPPHAELDDVNGRALLAGIRDVFNLLSSLNETNDKNEDSTLRLQHQMVEMSNERDAARNTSDELVKSTAKHKDELRKEQEGFVIASYRHRCEVEKWQRRVVELCTKCRGLESEMEAQKAIVRLWETKDKLASGGSRGSAATDSTSDCTADTTLDEHEALPVTPSEIEVDWTGMNGNGIMEPISEVDDVASTDGQQLKGPAKLSPCDSKQIDSASENLERVRDLNAQNSELLTKCQQLEHDNGLLKEELQSLKKKHEQKTELNDDLVERIGNLAFENGELVAKCQLIEHETILQCHAKGDQHDASVGVIRRRQCRRVSFDDRIPTNKRKGVLEMEHALATIKDLRSENDALHESIEEAMEVQGGVNDMLQHFVKSIRACEGEIIDLKEELRWSERSRGGLFLEKKRLEEDRDEAYHACQVLQSEIDQFRLQ